MAYYRRKYYRRRYRRYYYKRYKQASQNYFKVKAEFMDRIYYPDPNDPGADEGHAIFYSRRNEAVAANTHILTNNQTLTGYTYSTTLAGLFSYYKITGVRVEVTPDARNQSLPADSVEVPLYLSYRAGSDVGQTINEMRANNQTMLLNPVQKQIKYFRVFGGTSSYITTGQYFSGAWTLLGDALGHYARMPSYKVKIIYYFLYKQSKA